MPLLIQSPSWISSNKDGLFVWYTQLNELGVSTQRIRFCWRNYYIFIAWIKLSFGVVKSINAIKFITSRMSSSDFNLSSLSHVVCLLLSSNSSLNILALLLSMLRICLQKLNPGVESPLISQYFYNNVLDQSGASFAADKADFIAVHTFESDEFSCEVVSMKALLWALADSAGKQTEATAGLTGGAGVWALKFWENILVNVC